jgi:hypothetical protein
MYHAHTMTASDPRRPLRFDEFVEGLREFKGARPLGKFIRLLPLPFPGMADEFDESRFRREIEYAEALVSAMNPREREDSEFLFEQGNRRRIAEQAGVPFEEANLLIEQFYQGRDFVSRDDSSIKRALTRKYLMGAAIGLGLGLLAGGLTGGVFVLFYTPHGGGQIGDWTGLVVLAMSPIIGGITGLLLGMVWVSLKRPWWQLAAGLGAAAIAAALLALVANH